MSERRPTGRLSLYRVFSFDWNPPGYRCWLAGQLE